MCVETYPNCGGAVKVVASIGLGDAPVGQPYFAVTSSIMALVLAKLIFLADFHNAFRLLGKRFALFPNHGSLLMRHRFVFLAIALLLAVDALGSEPAVITGTITDADSGLPIAGATVAFGLNFNVVTTLTHADGTYSLPVEMFGSASRFGFIEAAGPDHAPARVGGEPVLNCYFACGAGDASIFEDRFQ